jgi:hypothetical protein
MQIADLTTQHYVNHGIPDYHKRMQELEAEPPSSTPPPALGTSPRSSAPTSSSPKHKYLS